MGRHHHYSFGSFIHDVGKVTKPIGHEISNLVSQVGPVVKPLERDIKSLVSGPDKDFNHIINTQSNIANNLINKIIINIIKFIYAISYCRWCGFSIFHYKKKI